MSLANDGSGAEFSALVEMFEGRGSVKALEGSLRELPAPSLRAVRAMLTPLHEGWGLLWPLLVELARSPEPAAAQQVEAMLAAIANLLGPRDAA